MPSASSLRFPHFFVFLSACSDLITSAAINTGVVITMMTTSRTTPIKFITPRNSDLRPLQMSLGQSLMWSMVNPTVDSKIDITLSAVISPPIPFVQ